MEKELKYRNEIDNLMNDSFSPESPENIDPKIVDWCGIGIADTSKRVYNKTNLLRGKWKDEASIQNSLKKTLRI